MDSNKSTSVCGSPYKSSDYSYELAVRKLNEFQSNAASILKSEKEGPVSHFQQVAKVEATWKYLERIGIGPKKLDSLSVIHISGTKGKGTTAALCESVLRHCGYRTGFFSSPHLIEVRERIRINGRPLSKVSFTNYFNYCYNQLNDKKENNSDMPAYFKFLTVMAFHVFLEEKIDVAVVEVGIGGEYDCTNCIRNPAVVGITSLGLDHTSILGRTLPDIAWQKGGIMKPRAIAFTVPQHSPAAMDVLAERAINRQCSLMVAPPLSAYTWETPSPFVHNIEDVYTTNTSLALQIVNAWMQLQSPYRESQKMDESPEGQIQIANGFYVTKKMIDGLQHCVWPGRTQILSFGNNTYFLDGAHTAESIKYCAEWYQASSTALLQDSTRRVLVFASTGTRDKQKFIQNLLTLNFDAIILTTTMSHSQSSTSDQTSVTFSAEDEISNLVQLKKCLYLSHPDIPCQIFPTVWESIEWIKETTYGQSHVLVTGSVRLVGAALRILDPNLEHSVVRIPKDLRPLHNVYKDMQAIL